MVKSEWASQNEDFVQTDIVCKHNPLLLEVTSLKK